MNTTEDHSSARDHAPTTCAATPKSAASAPATVRRTPLEAAIVDALRYRRAAEALDAEAAQATDAQWRLFYEKKAHAERTMEEYSLQQARDYAAVLLDAESAQ